MANRNYEVNLGMIYQGLRALVCPCPGFYLVSVPADSTDLVDTSRAETVEQALALAVARWVIKCIGQARLDPGTLQRDRDPLIPEIQARHSEK